jgi:hypothetical protein
VTLFYFAAPATEFDLRVTLGGEHNSRTNSSGHSNEKEDDGGDEDEESSSESDEAEDEEQDKNEEEDQNENDKDEQHQEQSDSNALNVTCWAYEVYPKPSVTLYHGDNDTDRQM